MSDNPRVFISPKELKPGQAGWGLYDTQDKGWFGNEAGPQIYINGEHDGKPFTGEEMARLGATIIGIRMKWNRGRLRATLYTTNANKPRGEYVPILSLDEALKQIKTGRV